MHRHREGGGGAQGEATRGEEGHTSAQDPSMLYFSTPHLLTRQPAALQGVEPRIVSLERAAGQYGRGHCCGPRVLTTVRLDNSTVGRASNYRLEYQSLYGAQSLALGSRMPADRIQSRLLHCLLPAAQVKEETVINLLGKHLMRAADPH